MFLFFLSQMQSYLYAKYTTAYTFGFLYWKAKLFQICDENLIIVWSVYFNCLIKIVKLLRLNKLRWSHVT